MRTQYDIIIVGGGVMGSSVAYHLLTLESTLKLVVIERDPTYARASTALSLGGVRIQFRLKENILMSLYAQEVFDRFAEEMAVEGERPSINFRREGYLYLIDSAGRPAANESLALQKKLGCEVEWWSPAEVTTQFPLLSTEVGFDFSWEWPRFTEVLWPELARIVPVFETLKPIRG